jgi:O-antigen ligase
MSELLMKLSDWSRVQNRMAWPWIALLCGGLLPLLLFWIMPSIGVGFFQNLLSWSHIGAIYMLVILGTLYWYFIDFIRLRPRMLLFSVLILHPWLSFLSLTLNDLGINNYYTAWIFMLFYFPAIVIALSRLKTTFRLVPATKILTVFTVILLGYFFFFQQPILDQRTGAGQFTLGFYFVYGFGFDIAFAVVAAAAFLENKASDTLKRLTLIIAINVAVYALVGIIAYQLKLLTIDDLGLQRARSIFYHPSNFGHYMCISMLYLLGMFLYFLKSNASYTFKSLLIGSVLLGFVGTVLSFSKTAIAALLFVCVLMILLNCASFSQLKNMLLILAGVGLLGLSSVLIFEKVTDVPMVEGFTKRINEGSSLDWRNRMAENLMADMNASNILLGNGMSASKVKLSEIQGFSLFRETGKIMKVVHVHNGYLALFYDYGLVGLIPFVLLISLMIQQLFRLLKLKKSSPLRALYAMSIALTLYYLIGCFFDPLFEQWEIPFWLLLISVHSFIALKGQPWGEGLSV